MRNLYRLLSFVVLFMVLAGQSVTGQIVPQPAPDDGVTTANEHPVIGPLVADIDQLSLRGIYLREQVNDSGCVIPEFEALWAQLLGVNNLLLHAVLRQDVDTIVRLKSVLENLIDRLEEAATHGMLECEFGGEQADPEPVPDPNVDAEPEVHIDAEFEQQYAEAYGLLSRFMSLVFDYYASGCESAEVEQLIEQITLTRTLLLNAMERSDHESVNELLAVLNTLIERFENELTHTLIDCECQAYEDLVPLPVDIE